MAVTSSGWRSDSRFNGFLSAELAAPRSADGPAGVGCTRSAAGAPHVPSVAAVMLPPSVWEEK